MIIIVESGATKTDWRLVKEDGSVVRISAQAFGACPNLTELTLPQSIMMIDAHAFSFCKNLKSLLVPSVSVQDEHFLGKLFFFYSSYSFFFILDFNLKFVMFFILTFILKFI